MKKKKIIIAICIGCLFIVFIRSRNTPSNSINNAGTPLVQDSFQIEIPDYKLINQSDYVRESQKCQGYRIITNTSITDDEIIAIYDEITHDSGYKYHTLWFYENEDDLTIPFATLDDEIESNGNPSIDR